jgi:hypothetical protein
VFKISLRPGVKNPRSGLSDPSAQVIITFISPDVEAEMKSLVALRSTKEALEFASKFGPTPQVAGAVYEAAAVKIIAAAKVNSYDGAIFEDSARTPLGFPPAISPKEPLLETIINRKNIPLILNQFYVPKANHPAFDAFIISDIEVTLLQITIARTHLINKKGIQQLYGAVTQQVKELSWRLLFVVPSVEVGEKLLIKERREGMPIPKGPSLQFGFVVLKLEPPHNAALVSTIIYFCF